jgi:predicted Rossmann fold nucleotide-binding protein DprA/Smf involved in DNA uptake
MSRSSAQESTFEQYSPPESLISGRKKQIKILLASKPLNATDLAKQLGFSLDDTLLALADLEREKKVFRYQRRWHLR